MNDNEKQCKTNGERRRPTKDASITFRAPNALDAALREMAQREDRSLGYIVCKALMAFVAANGGFVTA